MPMPNALALLEIALPIFTHSNDADALSIHTGAQQIHGMRAGKYTGTDQPVPFENPPGHGHQQGPCQIGRLFDDPAVSLLLV